MNLSSLPSIVVGTILAVCPAIVHAQLNEGDCGFDRWPVKVMRDVDASRIQRAPIQTTISALASIPIPEIPYPHDRRMAPYELRVYRVRGRIDEITRERDRDWHLMLSDPADPSATMVVEIPDPFCVEDISLRPVLFEARRVLRTVPRHGVVDVEGVGFFDFIHTQRARARNGFELHPVLSILRVE